MHKLRFYTLLSWHIEVWMKTNQIGAGCGWICGVKERLTLDSSLSQCSVPFNLIGRGRINITTRSFCTQAVSAAHLRLNLDFMDTVHRSFHQQLGIGFHLRVFKSYEISKLLSSPSHAWFGLSLSWSVPLLALPEELWPHNGWNSNMRCR